MTPLEELEFEIVKIDLELNERKKSIREDIEKLIRSKYPYSIDIEKYLKDIPYMDVVDWLRISNDFYTNMEILIKDSKLYFCTLGVAFQYLKELVEKYKIAYLQIFSDKDIHHYNSEHKQVFDTKMLKKTIDNIKIRNDKFLFLYGEKQLPQMLKKLKY